MPQLYPSRDHERRQYEESQHRTELRQDHYASAVGAIGNRAAEQGQSDSRDREGQAGYAKKQGRIGHFEDQPALRNRFHVLRQNGKKLSEPVETVVAVTQRANRLEYTLASGHGRQRL
jgi:hypothetical protein